MDECIALSRVTQVSDRNSYHTQPAMSFLFPSLCSCNAFLLEPLPLFSGYTNSSYFQGQAPGIASSTKSPLPAPRPIPQHPIVPSVCC